MLFEQLISSLTRIKIKARRRFFISAISKEGLKKILEKQFENAGEIYYILKIFSRLRQKS